MRKLFLSTLFLSLIFLSVGCSQKPTTYTQDDDVIRSGSCDIKGNISSSGEKIYHVPGCASYTKTKIDPSNGEEWFCSESEARSAGWRKAYNCS